VTSGSCHFVESRPDSATQRVSFANGNVSRDTPACVRSGGYATHRAYGRQRASCSVMRASTGSLLAKRSSVYWCSVDAPYRSKIERADDPLERVDDVFVLNMRRSACCHELDASLGYNAQRRIVSFCQDYKICDCCGSGGGACAE